MIAVTERPSRADATAGPTQRIAPGHGPGEGSPPTRITPEELATWSNGSLVVRGTRPIAGGSVDTRILRPGEAFFALPGERTDGHQFLEVAAAAGAGALVVTDELSAHSLAAIAATTAVAPDVTGLPTVVRVDDAGDALRDIARSWRDRFELPVVGITGSLAKTSTKEQVAEVLATRHVVLRSEGNLNNEIGLPLTLLRLRPEHEAAVLEMGFYVPGEALYESSRIRIGPLCTRCDRCGAGAGRASPSAMSDTVSPAAMPTAAAASALWTPCRPSAGVAIG